MRLLARDLAAVRLGLAEDRGVMAGDVESVATMVARALARTAPDKRGLLLRELLAHTAAGLVVIEGDRAASEAVYRLADAVSTRGEP